MTHRPDRRRRRGLILVLVGSTFLGVSFGHEHYWDEYFYLFSVRHHAPARLVAFEPALSDGIVPAGFFAGKIGFVTLLWLLVGAVGDGPQALLLLRLVFAALGLAVGAATYRLLTLLGSARAAGQTAVLTVFLPLSVYLGFKTLSETPALLFGTVAAWQLLASFHATGPVARGWRLGAAAVALAAATLCRVTGSLVCLGLVAGLLVAPLPGLGRRTLLRRSACVTGVALLLVVAVYGALGVSFVERLGALVASVTERQWSPVVRLYALALFGQLFWLPALFGFRPTGSGRLALAWLTVAVAPFLLLAEYAEPRYFAAALIPFAMLVREGMEVTTTRLLQAGARTRWLSVGLLLAMNRLIFAPLMPFELDERAYNRLMTRLTATGVATYLVPWVTDYCYLAFAYPDRRIVLVMSTTYGTGTVFETPEFRRWVGQDRYAATLSTLDQFPRPWVYVGWTYNPTVLRLKQWLSHLGLARWMPIDERRALLDHLTPSWIWSATTLTRELLDAEGPYRAFAVRPARSRDGRNVR